LPNRFKLSQARQCTPGISALRRLRQEPVSKEKKKKKKKSKVKVNLSKLSGWNFQLHRKYSRYKNKLDKQQINNVGHATEQLM
jgi:hypothetical protein